MELWRSLNTITGTVTVDTELPTQSALADSTANPTTTSVGTYLLGYSASGGNWDRLRASPTNADSLNGHAAGCLDTMSHTYMYNGSSWDRVRGDTTNGIDVDVTRVQGTVAVSGTFWQATQPVSVSSIPSHDVTNAGTFAVQAAQSGTWTVQPGNTANTTPWLVKESRSSSSSITSVSDTNASTTLLASNSSRLGATISNDSSAALYVLLGSGVASATNYTARLTQYGYYEVPFGYTGQINGIWASDPNDGGARMTELT